MSPDWSSPNEPADNDALERALQGWAAPGVPDDGFTLGVLQRVARWRSRPGLEPGDAWKRLLAHQQRMARQARYTGLGLTLGLAVAAVWLLAIGPEPVGLLSVAGPWALVLASAMAGLAGAAAWLAQWSE